MITLITGTPGAGKTLYAVSMVLPQFAGRQLFIDGIPDLLIDHELPAGPVDEWQKWLPVGAVLVVDECQRIWRARGAGSPVPAGVAAMETHRHSGNDIVLITQHPNLLDPNARRLVGRHLHVRRMFGWHRAVVYEWDSATDPARVSSAMKSSFSYPKSAFSLYKSSEIHQKRGNRVPTALIAAVVAAVALPVVLYFAYGKTQEIFASGTSEEKSGVGSSLAALGATQSPPGSVVPGAVLAKPDLPLLDALVLSDVNNPHSAPLYAAVRPRPVAPVVIGCVSRPGRCVCYTQQSTIVWVPEPQCLERVAGAYYDPFFSPANPPFKVLASLDAVPPAAAEPTKNVASLDNPSISK